MTTRTKAIGAMTLATALLLLGLLVWEYQRMHGAYDYEPVQYDYAPVVRK